MSQKAHSTHIITANEVAEYEYCPLIWWYEHFDPLISADDEELFAEMVVLEQEYGHDAPSLPEYQTIERLLIHRQSRQQYHESAEEVEQMVEEAEEERAENLHLLRWTIVTIVLLLISILLITSAVLLKTPH
jgi:hypothetical protein